jgi:hypothetical protein
VAELRDKWLEANYHNQDQDAPRAAFDAGFAPVRDALGAARTSARHMDATVREHLVAIASGGVVRFQANAVEVGESIDEACAQDLYSILDRGYVALKGLQVPLNTLGMDIGFFFQKAPTFERSAARLRESGDLELADYLTTVRKNWSESFLELRRRHVHEGWRLDRFAYPRVGPAEVRFAEPTVAEIPLVAFAKRSANRLCAATENLIAHAISRTLWSATMLREIPPEMRDSDRCVRFELALAGDGPPWRLSYSETEDFL